MAVYDLANGIFRFANFDGELSYGFSGCLEVIDQLHGFNMPNMGTSINWKMCPICPLPGSAHCGHNALMGKNRIAELRKAAGLSQSELAAAIGTTLNNLGKLERGARRLNQDWIEKIAKALSIAPHELLLTDTISRQSDASANSEYVSAADLQRAILEAFPLPPGSAEQQAAYLADIVSAILELPPDRDPKLSSGQRSSKDGIAKDVPPRRPTKRT